MLVNKTMLLCNISFPQQTHNKHQLCRHIAHVQTANHCQGEDLHTYLVDSLPYFLRQG